MAQNQSVKMKLVKYWDSPASWIEVPEDTPQEVIDAKVKKLQDQINDKEREIYDSFNVLRVQKSHAPSRVDPALEEVSGIVGGKRIF